MTPLQYLEGCNIDLLSRPVKVGVADKSRPARRLIAAKVELPLSVGCMPDRLLVCLVSLAPCPVSAVELAREGIRL